jgi:dTDP-4-amino-4,6-dideoxygalactose transaminase
VANRRDRFLPFSPPSITETEIAEVCDSLRSGWITTGPKVQRFEHDLAAFVEAPAALAVNSGTAALHVALATLGIGRGDAVITTPMTFCSSVHVIEHVGARPILVDVDADTLNIAPVKIAEAMDSSVAHDPSSVLRAILPVHLYGHPCEMDGILDIATHHGLSVIEDAAHALPARYKGRMVGNLGTLTAFSFYATKNLTTAEGGMLTGDPALIEEARIWSLHGMSRDAWKRYSSEGSWYYEVVRPGFKYNMPDIQAAIGIHQLRRLPEMQKRREEILARYDAAFAAVEAIQRPTRRPEVEHALHLYVIRLHLEMLSVDRSRFIEELKARNIGTSVHFIPIHLHPYYRERYGFRPQEFPVAFHEYQRIVSLPLYPGLTDADVEDVVEAVKDVVRQFRR